MRDKYNNKNLEEQKIKTKLTNMFDLPKEIVLNLPLISIIGKEEISIENYKGLVEYSEGHIRLNTSCGILKIEGRDLFIRKITTEYILVTGSITSLEYLI